MVPSSDRDGDDIAMLHSCSTCGCEDKIKDGPLGPKIYLFSCQDIQARSTCGLFCI